MSLAPTSLRPLLVATVIVAVFASSGCSWIRNKWGNEAEYQASRQNQPLEVPPGLDTPPTAGGVQIPEVSGNAAAPVAPGVPGSAADPAVAGIESFTLDDSVASSYRRIGIALGKLEGVTIGERAQLLNSYEVTYKGVTVLLRAEAAAEGTRVVALGPDGQPVRTGVATELLALLKARLG